MPSLRVMTVAGVSWMFVKPCDLLWPCHIVHVWVFFFFCCCFFLLDWDILINQHNSDDILSFCYIPVCVSWLKHVGGNKYFFSIFKELQAFLMLSITCCAFYRHPQCASESEKYCLCGLSDLDKVWSSGTGLEESLLWLHPQWPLPGNSFSITILHDLYNSNSSINKQTAGLYKGTTD